jgi:SAM-dependent methyltransferase
VTGNSPPEICDYEGSPWHTAFWPGRNYEDRAERIALGHLLPARGARLCEIGAGFGRLVDLYRGYERVILLDYARSMLQEAVERLRGDPRYLFVVADLYHLPLADSALDAAVTVRVLHHVADIPRALHEIARVVRPQGTYLTEFANKRHLKARLRYAFRHEGPDPDSREPYEFVKLNFDFHPRYIADQLHAAGFAIEDERAVSTFRLPLFKRLIPPRLLAAFDGALQHPTRRLEISPRLFLRASSGKTGAPTLNQLLWRCTTCGSTDIAETRASLVCRACARVYPIVDGIIDFKTEDEGPKTKDEY